MKGLLTKVKPFFYFCVMDALINQIKRLEQLLNFERIMNDLILQQGLDQLVIRLNTEGETTSQLFEQGVDAKGTKLEDIGGFYTTFTIQEKIAKGQPTDRITLNDTGDFYASFKVTVDNNGDIDISANTMKPDGDLQSRWGANLLGLTDENLEILREQIKEKLSIYLKRELQRA